MQLNSMRSFFSDRITRVAGSGWRVAGFVTRNPQPATRISYFAILILSLGILLSACGQSPPPAAPTAAGYSGFQFVTVTPAAPPSAPANVEAAAEVAATPEPVSPGAGDSVTFSDVAAAAGLNFRHGAFQNSLAEDPIAMMGGGLCWLDVDNDGWLDLYVVNSHATHEAEALAAQNALPRNALFRNLGNGAFADISAGSGADLALRGNGCVAADFNRDGWPDLFVTADGPNALLWNNGDGTFTEGAVAAGVASPEWNSAAAVTDLNRDGWPDLFVGAYIDLNHKIENPSGAFPQDFYGIPDRLYLNPGPGADGRVAFREVALGAGLDKEERALGALFTDVDQDGDPDLYIANDGHPNRLYINQPVENDPAELGFRLVDMTATADVGDSGSGMGLAGGDYDGDGRIDLLVTNWQKELNALYRNETEQPDNPLFQYSTYRIGLSGLGNEKTGWGTAWLDVENDTDQDLLIVHGMVPITDLQADRQLVRLYRNRSSDGNGSSTPGQPGQFLEATQPAGLEAVGPLLARGSAAADYDNDGDQDVAINSIAGPLVLLQNNGPHGNWLMVRANAFYPGLRVVAHLPAGRQLVRELYAGSSYLASEDTRLHFGLGQAAQVDRLEIFWPDGSTAELTAVPANQILTISPGEN